MQKENILKGAINDLIHADTFLCVSVKDGNLNMVSTAKPEIISTMLLAIMRQRPDIANAINLAALGYAQEQIHYIAKENQQ